jgi:hypothetical protein
MLISHRQAAQAGVGQALFISLSPDFSRMKIDMRVREVDNGLSFGGVVPEVSSASLRAAIISHREAFGKGRGDPQEEYVNIYNRQIRPVLPLFSLLLAVWQAYMSKAIEAHERKLGPLDILTLQPEWAERLDTSVQAHQGRAIWMLRNIRIPICSCRMLEIAQRQRANF